MRLNDLVKIRIWLQRLTLCTLSTLSVTAVADGLLIHYLDDANQEQSLAIDAGSPEADNALAAELILEHSLFDVIQDEKGDLEIIAEAVANEAPDETTANAIRNAILGVAPSLGGRSIQRTAEEPDTPPVPQDTPPLTPTPPPTPAPAPSPSPSPASPN